MTDDSAASAGSERLLFTPEQLDDWKAYEAVRLSGAINMFDAIRGACMARLSVERYMFALKNYSELKKAALP